MYACCAPRRALANRRLWSMVRGGLLVTRYNPTVAYRVLQLCADMSPASSFTKRPGEQNWGTTSAAARYEANTFAEYYSHKVSLALLAYGQVV